MNNAGLWQRLFRKRTPSNVYSPGRWDIQDRAEYWNEPSRIKNDTGKIHDGYVVEHDPMVDQIANTLATFDVPDCATLLEFGCGGGRILMLFEAAKKRYEKQWLLFGFDHAQNAVDLARSRTQAVRFMCAEDLTPFRTMPVNRFDLIFTHTALQHNSGWKQDEIYPLLNEFLKPNGILWLINEKTFDQEEVVSIIGYPDLGYCDDRASAGTPYWWINRIKSHGFELCHYDKDATYVFKKI